MGCPAFSATAFFFLKDLIWKFSSWKEKAKNIIWQLFKTNILLFVYQGPWNDQYCSSNWFTEMMFPSFSKCHMQSQTIMSPFMSYIYLFFEIIQVRKNMYMYTSTTRTVRIFGHQPLHHNHTHALQSVTFPRHNIPRKFPTSSLSKDTSKAKIYVHHVTTNFPSTTQTLSSC